MRTNRETAIDYSDDCFRNDRYSFGDVTTLMSTAQVEILEELRNRFYENKALEGSGGKYRSVTDFINELKEELK